MFKVGDKVDFLNEEGGGVVIEILNDSIKVETEDGFDYEYAAKDLVKSSDVGYEISDATVEEIRNQEERVAKNANFEKKFKHIDKIAATDEMEVDLHIESLISSHKGMANYDIVQVQMSRFRRSMNLAVSKKARKVIFIHGVGAGILRQEIRNELKAFYPEFEFLDGSYQRYGAGATEVLIR